MKKYQARYTVKKLYTDTFAISDKGIGQGPVYMYLLAGAEKALLIDSGYGLLNLREAVKTVTDKEIICVCTHGHVDHALGACQFENAYLHSNDFEVYRRHTDPQTLNDIGYKGIMKLPKRMLKNESYLSLVRRLSETPHPELKPLDGIEQFDLGGRIVSWRLIPGHTQGSIALLDEQFNTVFDGDGAQPGAWLFLQESSGLGEYAAMLENYLSFLSENNVKRRYVGHTGTVLGLKSVTGLINCVKTAERKPAKGVKVKTLFGDARIVISSGSALFCKR
jgi:glyoxylase-like metal-dependent hydrolase (beta-lactamase superfamily II)